MPDGIAITVEGMDQLMSKSARFKELAIQELAAGLYERANVVMTQAKENCPVDLGALRSTGTVAEPEIS